jgi:hypothetical protein
MNNLFPWSWAELQPPTQVPPLLPPHAAQSAQPVDRGSSRRPGVNPLRPPLQPIKQGPNPIGPRTR